MQRSRTFAPPSPSGSNRRTGFTLVELLVVIGIVLLLMSLLVPSLRRARSQSKELQCLTNLKGIAAASACYAGADPTEQTIPVTNAEGLVPDSWWLAGAYSWGGKAGRGNPTLGEIEVTSTWGTAQGMGPSARPLNRILYRSGFADYRDDPGTHQANWLADTQLEFDLCHCPADRGYTGFHLAAWRQSGLTSYDHYGTSYTANAYATSTGMTGIGRFASFSTFHHAVSQIPNPSNTIYYFENAGRFSWAIGQSFW